MDFIKKLKLDLLYDPAIPVLGRRGVDWLPWLMPIILATQEAEDHGSKPAQANRSRDPISKNTHHKKGQVVWLKW
jgi:hypothetical protein